MGQYLTAKIPRPDFSCKSYLRIWFRCNFDNDFWTESGPLFTELCHVIPSRLVVEGQARLHKLLQGLGWLFISCGGERLRILGGC